MAAKRVKVVNGNSSSEMVDITVVMSTGQAMPTNRVLEHYLGAEYQEQAVLPDGRNCLKIYQFDYDEVKDAQADGNDTWEEDLPWNEEHVDHVVIYD